MGSSRHHKSGLPISIFRCMTFSFLDLHERVCHQIVAPHHEHAEAIGRDARNAIECAIAMSEAMQQLNRRWEEKERPTARLRVGIQTGPAVVGSLGSDERLKFSSVGDTVNTAARLEGFDKEGFAGEGPDSICRILIGKGTFQRVKEFFAIEPLGEHLVPGRAERIPIYRVHADESR